MAPAVSDAIELDQDQMAAMDIDALPSAIVNGKRRVHGARARKLVMSAAAFAIAILLLVPWSGRRHRGFAGLALLPLAVWIAMLASVIAEDRRPDDAVVMDDVVLRAADSAGAPAALPQPLPRGVEVTVLERRDTWTKVRLSGGMAGWVPAGAVERVAR